MSRADVPSSPPPVEPDVEVFLAPVKCRAPLGYCKGLKHPTAYQRNVLVRCHAPLYTEEAKEGGYCAYCQRKARDLLHRDKEFAKLQANANAVLKEADAYVSSLSKGTRKREKLLSRIQKKRRTVDRVVKPLKEQKRDVEVMLDAELKNKGSVEVVAAAKENAKELCEKALTIRGLRDRIHAAAHAPTPPAGPSGLSSAKPGTSLPVKEVEEVEELLQMDT